MTGPSHPRRTELFGSLPRTHLVGRVADDLVPGLMACAAAVVVPSKEEGFGLPALEAMAVRTPLVAADTSSFPEVVGDGGLLVDPTPAGLPMESCTRRQVPRTSPPWSSAVRAGRAASPGNARSRVTLLCGERVARTA